LQDVVGPPESDEDEEPFEEKMPRLVAELERQFAEARKLEAAIRRNVADWQKTTP
jgi:type I restriction enzyme M protein